MAGPVKDPMLEHWVSAVIARHRAGITDPARSLSAADHRMEIRACFRLSNDLVTIDGAAIVDGILNVNGLDNFGVGVFTLALFNGPVTYNTLNLGQAPPGYDYEIVCDQSFAGSSKALLLYVTEAVPEPSSISLVALAGMVVGRRVRRR